MPGDYPNETEYANETYGLTTTRPKQTNRKWLYIGVPVAIAVILAAVLGGVLGSRASNKNKSSSSSSDAASSSATGEAAASQAASIKEAIGLFPTGTDSLYLLPLYPSTVSSPRYPLRARS